MARDLSYADCQHIKQTIKDAYSPAMRDKFPSSTPEVPCHSSDPDCPIGVDFLILNIQITLLRVADKYAVMLFRQQYEQGIALRELGRRQRCHPDYVVSRIDRMLDDAIDRMKQATASMILSVYWAMHERGEVYNNKQGVSCGRKNRR
jgi:hypothetical protein